MKTENLDMRLQIAIVAMIAVVIVVANVIVTHNVLTEPFPGHNDFLSRWEGARTFFQDGHSPYSDAASLNIQERIYGRPVEGNEDPGFFVYPFYTVFIVGPTVGMDYAWASAVWMVLLEVCLIASLMLLFDLFQWKPPVWAVVLVWLWGLFDYFAGRGLFLGQPSHVVYFMQILSLWALYRGYNTIGGTALAISTFKPQMGYLMVPFVLLWAIRTKRWRFVASFGVAFGGLMLASFIAEPSWFGDWLDQVRQYPDYTAAAYPDTGSPVWIITQHYLGLGNGGEWLLNIALALPMLWGWYQVLIRQRHAYFLWVVMLTQVTAHLIALRTATPHFVVFNLAVIFYLRHLSTRYGFGASVAALYGLATAWWALFLITVQGRDTLEHPLMFLPFPIGLFILLWWTRRVWWESAPRFDLAPIAGES